jgi:peptide deformylase
MTETMDLTKDLVYHTDSVLVTKTERFNFGNPPINPSELAHMLAQTMLKWNGIGLAAPQIGMSYRAFVIKANPIICCFNPIIVDKTEEMDYLEEGCLSFPGIVLKKKRHKSIKVRYAQPDGEVLTKTFTNMTSRIFQHELDHLDGVCFTHGMSRVQLEMLVKKAQKMGYKYSIGDLIKK